jgi:phosphomannomutase
MREDQCELGGEGNGGVVWMPVVPIRDSLGAMALTLALMARTGRPIGAAVERIPRYAIEKRKIDAAGVEGLQADSVDAPVAESLREAFSGNGGATVTTQDGIRLDFEAPDRRGRAWVHVRPSNTEPIVRLIAEAPTPDDASSILDRAEAIVTRGVNA